MKFIKRPAGIYGPTGKPGTKLELFKHEIRSSQTKKNQYHDQTKQNDQNYCDVNKTKGEEKQLAKSTLKPYVSVTLSHAETRDLSQEEVCKRLVATFQV